MTGTRRGIFQLVLVGSATEVVAVKHAVLTIDYIREVAIEL
jgi:hypothetical protein